MSDITIGAAIIVGKDRLGQLRNLLPQLEQLDQVVVVNTQGQGSVRNLCKKYRNVTYLDRPWRDSSVNHEGKRIVVHPVGSRSDFDPLDQYKSIHSIAEDLPQYEPNDWGFAYARNESFKALKTTHAIWLDTDDLIGTEFNGKEHLLSSKGVRDVLVKIATEGPDIDIWFFDYLYSHDEIGNVNVRHTRERFMKMECGWRWVYPIHEVPVPGKQPKHAVVKDVAIFHNPTIDPAKAGERNYRMLTNWLHQLEERNKPEERHDLARARLNVGDTLWGMERYRESAEWLVHEYLSKHPEALDLEKWTACIFAARSYISCGELIKAREMALLALAIEPGLSDSYYLLAEIKLMMEEDPQDVLILIETAATKEEPPPQLIKNPLDYTFTPYLITSEAKYQLGQYDAALQFALKAQEIRPTDKKAEEARLKASQKVRERDAAKAALALYQYLQDYDENEKAGKLYEVLPYVTQQHSDVREVAVATKRRVQHLWDDDVFEAFHNGEWTPTPFDWFSTNYIPSRDLYAYVLRRLKPHGERIKRILVVGCLDGYHSLLLAKEGYEVVGIDINEKAITTANEYAAKLSLTDQAKFIHGYFERMDPEKERDPFTPEVSWFQRFDAVLCLEYLDKCQRPDLLLGSLGDCARDGAPVIVSIPDGAFDKGDIPTSRNDDSARVLRVFTQDSFEYLLLSNPEFRAVESHFIPYADAYREGQGWQVGELRRVPVPNGPRIKIVCGNAVEPFSPDNLISGEGIGGSETAVIHMARHFAAMGCLVSVYGTQVGIWDGVFYRHFEDLNPDAHCAVYIAWRLPQLFSVERPNADVTVLWTHDLFFPMQIPAEWVERIDRIAVLSEFHKNYIQKIHPTFTNDKLWVTRNGIDPARYAQEVEKQPYNYFFTSSHERGLKDLIEIWPQIKEAIPDAILHVGYGTYTAEHILKNKRDGEGVRDLYAFVELMKQTDGVVVHGRLNQWDLARLQLSCEAWLYPYQDDWLEGGFLETYCITALEAQAAGAIPFTRLNGALPEVVKNRCEWTHKLPISLVVETLHAIHDDKTSYYEVAREENREWALSQSWQSLATEWMKEFADLAETKKLTEIDIEA